MATSAKKITNKRDEIQSKAQKVLNEQKEKVASTTQATQAGSTTTPTVTDTPKVTPTAKAMPTMHVIPVSQAIINTSSITPTNNVSLGASKAMDLLSTKTTPTLKKSATPDLLNGETKTTGIAGAINKWLYEKPQQLTQEFIKTDLFEKSKNIVIDTSRFGISTVQGRLEKLGTTPLVGLPKSVQEGEMGTKIKEQRNETLKSAFDKLESRDQRLSKDKGYKEAKKRAEERSASGKSMRQALQEGNWDVYFTRGGEIIAQIIPALATSIITKNPKAVAGTVFTTVYGDAYKRNLTDVVKDPDFKDLTGEQKTDIASLLATAEAGIETIGDMLELAPFMKGKTSFSKMLGIKNALASFVVNRQGTAATEGLEEVSTEVLQTFIKQAYGSLDKVSLKELWQIFSDTYALMQVAGLPGGAGGVIETRNRNRKREELSREADKYDNFNDFESAAERGGVEDKELIQEAWSKSKGLTPEQTEILKADVKYVEKQEKEATKLYEEKNEIEKKISNLREESEEKNEKQISKLESQLQKIDNQINEIDRNIQEYMEVYGEQDTSEDLPAQQGLASIKGGENLSEQTMRDTGIELGGGVKSYQTKTPEFKNWFKDSQVVDKEGNPLVVYHGTRHNIKVPNMKKGKEFAYGAGMYFTTSKEGAQHYSESKKGLLDNFRKPRVMEVYLSIQNPIKEGGYRWDNKWIEELKNLGYNVNEEYLSRENVSVFDKYFNLIMMQGYKKLPKLMEDFSRITGYDGLMVEQPNGEQYWIAFRPEQIKSATDNIGTFDVNDSNIKRDVEYHLPSTGKDYESFAEAIKQPQNDILKKLPISDLMKIEEGARRMRASATPELVKSLDFVKTAVQKELEERYNKDKKPEETKPTETIEEPSTFKDAQDYIDKMLDYEEKKAGHKLTDTERHKLTAKYSRNFLRKNIEGDFSKHMPGLKGVNLKQVEGELTDERLADIANMLALVSDTFGVDFNKLITDKNLSLNIAQNVGTYLSSYGTIGIMLPKNTKDKLRELLISKGFPPALADVRGEDIATAGVAISLKDGLQKAGETMAHELWHFIDFATSLEEGLPLRLVKDSSGTHIDYTSIIAKQRGWRTFNLFDVRKGTEDYNYYNDPSEILARYAEQYFAYIHDNESFKELAYTKEGYWTPEEFEKLLPKFESLVRGRIGGKLLDKGNEFYYDVMNRIRDNKFARISAEFDRGGLFKSDVKQRIEFMKEEYAFIMSHINEMTGTLKEEMEAYVQLSNLQQNYEMAKTKGEEYLQKLQTTPEQQGTIDNITTTALPPEPTPGNPNPEPPQNPETIKNGLPQLGGSNIENGIGNLSEGGNGGQLGSSYMEENTIINIRKRKNKIKNFRKELSQTWKDIFTPTISRIYNISPRVAGRLITMETQKDINIHRYRQKAKGFVETLGKLKGNQALEVKKALLDYGALASEQGENIEQYKEEEVAKLREVLLRNGFKEQDINDMFYVLDDIGQQYKDAGLSVNLTDMYFPRVVKDYEGLIDYMNRVSGKDIKVNKTSLMIRIKQIQQDPNMTEEEKERRIRNAISMEFKQPGTTSQHGKERKMGKLSDWGEGIYAYYESPIESIDHYIVTMTNAIQRQLFLGGLKEDANIDSDIITQDTAESVSQIIGKLVEDGMINEEDVEELQKSILAVLNKKPSPKSVTALKDITYIATITNFLSAINQLDDLGMVILKDRSGLKHIVKAIFGKANIKYDDLGLEDSYEMFREEGGITNWLFKKSLFSFFDRLGKTSFINTAWESLIHQSKNEKTRKYLYDRLVSMYGQESADRMMEKIDSGNYMGDDGQIDIEILRDLLYQLGSTQPLYTSAMPTTYLNHPWSRLCYALSSFTLKRIDWLVQGAKEVNAKHGAVAAGAWVMGVSAFLAMFGAAIGDVGDLLKGKKEETFLWNLINNGIEDALKSGGSDALNSWLKIWDLSDYDIKLYKQQGLWGVLSSKIKPFVFDLGKDITEAITEHDANEITDLAKYVPIFGKLVYYWCWEDLESNTKSGKKKDEWDFSGEEEWDFSGDDEWDFSGEEEWDFS